MRLEQIVIAFLMAIMVILGGTMIVTEQSETYNITIDNQIFQNVTNITNQVYSTSEEIKGDLNPDEVSSTYAEDNLILGGYRAITKVWSFVGLIDDIMISLGKELGIPPIFMQITWIILLLLIAFGLIYMIFKFQPR